VTGLRQWLVLGLLACGCLQGASAAKAAENADPDVVRLVAVLNALEADPALADKAALERFKARQALANLQVARSRDRPHALILANAWVEAAQDAAQAEMLAQQSRTLDQERDQILIQASRRDAEMARREADRLRLQSLAREEEAQRLAESMEQDRLAAEQSTADVQAQASQALKLADARARETALARKEAELAAAVAADSLESRATPPPSRRVGNRTIYTLPGTAFASGSTSLTAAARASLMRMAAAVGNKKSVRIEAHTDSQGADAANLTLSQKRAEAVRQVLVGAGMPAARIKAVGKGETTPLADNGSAEGRARNRRVEIVVE
jgi:outer membrane protein OmpA-like peptidoglycan-associated protein